MPSTEDIQFVSCTMLAGYQLLPMDIVLSPVAIRKWAADKGLIFEAESQMLIGKRKAQLAQTFSSSDNIGIAISITPYPKHPDELLYLEYPCLPVRTLISRASQVAITYWRLDPSAWDRDLKVLSFGQVTFGFLFPRCAEEIVTTSTAKQIVASFTETLDSLGSSYLVQVSPDGAREVTVDGAVLATFSKAGRNFLVQLQIAPHEPVP